MPDLPLPKPTMPKAAPPPASVPPVTPKVPAGSTPASQVKTPAIPPTKPPASPAFGSDAAPKAAPLMPKLSQSPPAAPKPVAPNTTPAVSPKTAATSVSSAPPQATPSNVSTPTPVPTTAPALNPPISPPASPTELKPPAVVTALSSMSSNNLPKQKEPGKVELDGPSELKAALPTQQPLAGSTKPGLGIPGRPMNLTTGSSSPPTIPPTAPRTPSGAPPATPPPKLAKAKRSPLRFLPFIVGGIALLLVVVFVAMRFLGGGSSSNPAQTADSGGTNTAGGDQPAGSTNTGEPVTLEYWGLWEPKETMDTIFADFEKQNPGISVQYVAQSYQDYRERLQTAIASKTGPDVFRFHATWAPMLTRELAPLPSSVLTATDFESAFYPVARAQLTINNQIYGVPLMYDGLMLYYNKEIFAAAGLQPPTTWAELRTAANTLTVREGNEVKRAGVALGTASNVEHFSDIIGLLMLQNGAKLDQPNSPEGRDALLFYTNFATKDNVWSDIFPSSTVAFARGDVAMMLAPSWRAFEVQAMNPDLDFATAPVPQLSDERIAWASYWAEGVNALSEHQDAAWKLVQYLSSSSVEKQLYGAQAQVRSFGEPYARKDLASELASQPLVAPVLQDAPYAQGWYMTSYTHDNGLNDQIAKYYLDAVNALNTGKDVPSVLTTLNSGVQQVLIQYNLAAPAGQSAI